jgi:predicted lipid-binding transport protein (Tim44 family)
MSADEARDSETRVLVLGGGVIAVLGIGWFVLSHVVMKTPVVDAIVEALGVMLALLVVASVIGSVVRAHRDRRRGQVDEQ